MHDLFYCPACRGELEGQTEEFSCGDCGKLFVSNDGYVDFLFHMEPMKGGFAPRLMRYRWFSRIYTGLWRPSFTAAFSMGKMTRRREYRKVKEAFAKMGLNPGTAFLDVSCGPGPVVHRLQADFPGAEVVGLDLSVAMLRECVRIRGDAKRPIFILADAARMPLKSGAFTGAYAGAALHIWPDPAAILAEISRVIAPGGRFLASTFLHHRTAALRHTWDRGFEWLSDVRVFTEEELHQLFKDAGFSITNMSRWHSYTLVEATREPGGDNRRDDIISNTC
tara:strand:- start:138 stop:974 length:837 start_codon:yes stop_codon:yes gene_type:complete